MPVVVTYWSICWHGALIDEQEWFERERGRLCTSYLTQEEAEAVAFDIVIRFPVAMGWLFVEKRRMLV